jgi:hypothetical protein
VPPSTVEHPGERAPAPARLAVVQDFVNSADLEADDDRLTTVETMTDWFRQIGLPQDGAR